MLGYGCNLWEEALADEDKKAKHAYHQMVSKLPLSIEGREKKVTLMRHRISSHAPI